MRKWKTALSLSLALALSLTLAVPAFAAESSWKVEVPGKSSAEVFVGAKTFTVRDWVVSGTYEDDEYSVTGSIWTKTDNRQWTAENVYVLSRGDEVVFTKGGESFEELCMTAWSDPDEDGVYDMRIADLYAEVTDPFEPSAFLPINTAGPVRSFDARTAMFFYMPGPFHWQMVGGAPDGYGYWDAVCTGGTSEVTELKMRPDFLLNIYGPNTIVNISTPDKSWSCTILVEVKLTQPTTPEQPDGVKTANPSGDKLSVNGVEGSPTVYNINNNNYFKIRDVAALLSGTEKQFSVGYDGEKQSVTATTGQSYDKLATDLAGKASAAGEAKVSSDTIYVNGQKIEAEVYNINGNNYFKLRDLGKALNFYVGWTLEQGVCIETNKPYSE